MSTEVEHPFEMTDVLANTMTTVAEKVREHGEDAINGKQYEVEHAVREVINAHVDDYEDRQTLISCFKTSYENACTVVKGNRTEGQSRMEEKTFALSLADSEAIYTDHDGKMEAGTHFDGSVVKEVRSRSKRASHTTDERLYLIYEHADTRHQFCNCPSMRFNFICKHTLANILDRNLPEPTDVYE